MSTLYLDEASMLKKIEELKYQKKRIDDVLEKVKGDTLKITDYWVGETGDIVHEELDEYVNEFDYISSKLQKQITVLERVVRDYNRMGVITTTKIDENVDNSAIA